jgi:hypothetical protein
MHPSLCVPFAFVPSPLAAMEQPEYNLFHRERVEVRRRGGTAACISRESNRSGC